MEQPSKLERLLLFLMAGGSSRFSPGRTRRILLWALTSVALLAAADLQAQFRRGISAEEERAIEVRASEDYHYGEGWGTSVDEAKEAARRDMVNKIAAQVFDHQELDWREDDSGVAEQYRRSSRVISAMEVRGLNYLSLPAPGKNHRCLAFVSKEDMQAGMDRQRVRIRSMVGQALAAAEQGRLDDALRLSYGAYLLTWLVDSVAVDWPGVQLSEGRDALLEGIGRLVRQVRFEAGAAVREGRGFGVPLRVVYQDKPATVDLSLYTGAGTAYPHVSHGHGYLELHWDPDEFSNSRKDLRLQLRYAYPGRMRHFPEMEAVYEVFQKLELDTWRTVEVFLPPSPSPSPPAPPPEPSPLAEREWPRPILHLARQSETTTLMQALDTYVRHGRLAVYAQRPSSQAGELYVAVVAEQHVLGVFLADQEGYLQVLRQRRLTTLQHSELAGASQIWIVHPPEGKRR